MYSQNKPGPKPTGRVAKASSNSSSTPINSEHRRTQLREAQRRHRQRLRDEFDRLQGRVANLEQELTRSQQERDAMFIMMRGIMYRINSQSTMAANTLPQIPPQPTPTAPSTTPTANIHLSPPSLPATTTATTSDWYPPTPSDCSTSSVLDAAALQQANAALLDSAFQQQQQQRPRPQRQAPPPQQPFPTLAPDMQIPLDAKFTQSTAYPTESDFMSWDAFAACMGKGMQAQRGAQPGEGGWDWGKGLGV